MSTRPAFCASPTGSRVMTHFRSGNWSHPLVILDTPKKPWFSIWITHIWDHLDTFWGYENCWTRAPTIHYSLASISRPHSLSCPFLCASPSMGMVSKSLDRKVSSSKINIRIHPSSFKQPGFGWWLLGAYWHILHRLGICLCYSWTGKSPLMLWGMFQQVSNCSIIHQHTPQNSPKIPWFITYFPHVSHSFLRCSTVFPQFSDVFPMIFVGCTRLRPARHVEHRSQEAQGTPGGGCGSGDDHQPQEGQGHRGGAAPWQVWFAGEMVGKWWGNDGDVMWCIYIYICIMLTILNDNNDNDNKTESNNNNNDNRRKFRSETSDNMDSWKAEVRRVRREKIRRKNR